MIDVLLVVNMILVVVAIGGWWRAVTGRRESNEALVLRASVSLARQLTGVRDADVILAQLLRILRRLHPEGGWKGVSAPQIERARSEGIELPIPLDALEEALREGERVDTTTTVLIANLGGELPFIVISLGDRDDVHGVLFADPDVVTRDELKRLEMLFRVAGSALRAAAQQEVLMTAERLAAVGRLAAGIAHEINNPLAYVMLNLENLEPRLTDEEQEWCADALHGTRRIARILTGLRATSRTGRLETREVDLTNLARDTALVARAKDMSTPIEVRGEPLRVVGDEVRLSQILLNLITNAIDAVADVPDPRVEIEVGMERGRAVVDVHDNGPGVSDTLRARIFEEGISTKGRNGQGLGLYIARSLARAHDGAVELVSSGPSGSVFRLALNLARAGSSIPIPKSTRPPAAEGPEAYVPRILLIDDEPAILRGLKRILRNHAHVVTCEKGGDALTVAADGSFDLILCDLNMPGLDGMQFYEALRQINETAAKRVVIVTGSLDVDLPIPVVRKPIETATIFELLEERTEDPSAQSAS